MYQRILVPIDGSTAATLGLNEAIKLAGELNATLQLVHIIDGMLVISPDAAGYNPGLVLDTLRTDADALLKAAGSAAREAGVKVDTVLIEAMGGQAGARIVQQANEWAADLIVCGTHGRRGMRRLILGSDAEYIVRHTPVPVLLIRIRETAGD